MTRSDLFELAAELVAPSVDTTRRTEIAALLDAIEARPGDRPEDVLLDVGLVDDRRLAFALALRSGRRYEGLRGFVPQHRLFLYVPLALAQRERVVPIVMVGDTLTLASAFLDPDLGLVRERFPNLKLDLALAPRNEILDALQRVGV